MEAALLNAAIMSEVDCNSNVINAELEVKKLQELVRKLERQNEQLRIRTSGGGGGCPGGPLVPPSRRPCKASLGSFSSPPQPFEYFQPHTADNRAPSAGVEEEEDDMELELELLDLDSLCSVDAADETWLYQPSKAKDCTASSLTPLQWCRQVLDHPKTELEAARRSLSLQLEHVSRWRSSLSSPSPSSSPAPPVSQVAGVSPIISSPCSTPQFSERHVKHAASPSLSSPLLPVLHRTLSPLGKNLSPVAERAPTFLPHPASRTTSLRRSVLSPQSSLDSDRGVPEVEDDSISLGYKLQDLTDVQVMARLQEESLRQEYASTTSVLATRRSQSFSFQLSQLSAGRGLEQEDDEEEDDEDYGLLPPPQPRLTRLPHSHTFSSITDWRRSTSCLASPPSTPPFTPFTPPHHSAGFAVQPLHQGHHQALGLGLGSLCVSEQQGFRPGSDEFENKLRRSLPNLVRAPSLPCVPMPTTPTASPSLLRNSLSFDSSGGLSRLQSSIPPPGQLQNRVQSIGNFSSSPRHGQTRKATAYVSPTIKGSTSTSLQSLNINSTYSPSSIPLLSKAASGGCTPTSSPGTPRSSLPRPASFVGVMSSTPRSKMMSPARSLLTPPRSLSTLSALRDGTWRDGCY